MTWIRIRRSDAGGCALFAATAVVCYAPGIPLAFAFAGLAALALARDARQRFCLALGWHAAPALPAAAGIWNMGASPGAAALLALWWLASGALFARFNTGLAAAITLCVPWHIGSAALAAGDIWPGTGVAGIALAALTLGGIDAGSARLAAVTAGSAAALSAAAWSVHVPHAPAPGANVPVPHAAALTSEGRDRALMRALPIGRATAVLLGENMIDVRQPGALDRWCSLAAAASVRIYAGALEPDHRSTIREFAPDHCDARTIYARRVGLPGIAGGWSLGSGHAAGVTLAGRPIRWLICFETFVPAAWLLANAPPGAVVVIAANDRWLHPVPMAVLRRKAARAMSRLVGAAPAFAATGRTAVIVRR